MDCCCQFLRAFYEAAKSASPPGQRLQVWDDVKAYEVVSGRRYSTTTSGNS